MNRRSFLKGAAALVLAPGIVHAENIMKIWVPKGNRILTPDEITREALRILHEKMDFLDCFIPCPTMAGANSYLTAEEFKMDIDEFTRRHITPAIERLAAVTDANINFIPWNRSDWV